MGSTCAERSQPQPDVHVIDSVFYVPTRKGWEDAELFKVGHVVENTVW